MHDLIFDKGYPRNLGKKDMTRFARRLGLDMPKFKSDMNGDCPAVVRREQAQMKKVGTVGTPAFFINGRFLSGARPIQQFKQLIDEELRKAKKRIADGKATAKSYYKTFVLGPGKKKFER